MNVNNNIGHLSGSVGFCFSDRTRRPACLSGLSGFPLGNPTFRRPEFSDSKKDR